QLPKLVTAHAAILLAPPVERQFGNADLANGIRHRHALAAQNLNLPKLRDDLVGLVSLVCHCGPPSWSKPYFKVDPFNGGGSLQQPAIVEPVDPFQRRELDGLERAPWPASMDHFGLVQAVDRLGESVVVRVADAADGGLDARFGQALGILDRHILDASVRMMHQTASMDRAAIMQRLFERIENEARMRRSAHPPADDPAGIGIDDEGHVDKASPG